MTVKEKYYNKTDWPIEIRKITTCVPPTIYIHTHFPWSLFDSMEKTKIFVDCLQFAVGAIDPSINVDLWLLFLFQLLLNHIFYGCFFTSFLLILQFRICKLFLSFHRWNRKIFYQAHGILSCYLFKKKKYMHCCLNCKIMEPEHVQNDLNWFYRLLVRGSLDRV